MLYICIALDEMHGAGLIESLYFERVSSPAVDDCSSAREGRVL